MNSAWERALYGIPGQRGGLERSPHRPSGDIVDKQDQDILGLLRENSRYSVRQIAEKLAMRPSTVHQRMQRLIKQGIIQGFTVKTDDAKIGEDLCVFMMLKGSPNAAVLKDPAVKEAYAVTGEYNHMLKLKFQDMKALNTFMAAFRLHHPDQATLTMVATEKMKEI